MNIADKAKEIIEGDREKTYGDPSKNLTMIAGMWSAYIGVEIKATDVCNMMSMLKIARLKNQPSHEDSKVDLIGYTLLHDKVTPKEPDDKNSDNDNYQVGDKLTVSLKDIEDAGRDWRIKTKVVC